jgi:hypothetical protein
MKFQLSSPPVKGWGIMETSENIPVKIETHQLRDGKRDRELKIVAFNKAPTGYLTVLFGVQGKPGCLANWSPRMLPFPLRV